MKRKPFAALRQDASKMTYFIRQIHRFSRGYLPLAFFTAFCSAVTAFLPILLPKYLLDELLGLQRIERLVFYTIVLVVGIGASSILNRYLERKMDLATGRLLILLEAHLGRHLMDLDYATLENPQFLAQKDQALFAINNQNVLLGTIRSLTGLLRTSLSLIGLASLVAALHPILILIMLGIVAANAALLKKSQDTEFRFHQELIPLNRHFLYYSQTATDLSMAKDVRLFHMKSFLMEKFQQYQNDSFRMLRSFFRRIGRSAVASHVVLQLQWLAAYAYLIWQFFRRTMGIGDFTMYLGAANQFAQKIGDLFSHVIQCRQMCRYLGPYFDLEKTPLSLQGGDLPLSSTEDITISFRHVWFRYPNSSQYALEDICLDLRAGEKLAIVGPNGAGKTTLVKLLCRLYEPERGSILINDVPVGQYRYDDYRKLLAVVFQDYQLFAFSIRENLAFQDNENDQAVWKALREAGLAEKVTSLDKGIDTPLNKNFDPDGVEFSGGEKQKLAIARAIYANAPVVVLDEPTAALDSYAEQEIYQKFLTLMKDKTAVCISHRLSICRFCHRIAVLDHGKLVEQGTPSQLEQAGGLYSRLWQAQAQYYQQP